MSEPEPALAPTPTAPPPPGPAAKTFVPPTPGEAVTSELTGNTYTMAEKIGEGSFGEVYGCTDMWTNDLAAKVLKPLKSYEAVKASALAELQKLVQLRHPNITYAFDAFEYRETFYIITERCYCSVSDLFKLPEFNGLLWLRPIARSLLQAVHFTHLNGLVHQDIHSGNVFTTFVKDEMLRDNPERVAMQFRLGDLGVAKFFSEIDAKNTRAQWMLPPEAIDSSEFGPLDHRIDIYHSGLLFLQLALSQEMQFTPEERKSGKPREMALQLSAPLNFALEKALRRHVQNRTAGAMELWRDLNSPVVDEGVAPGQQQPQGIAEAPPADPGG